MFFDSPETYLNIIEIHALIQGCVLAYLLGMGRKGPIKYWMDRVVMAYFCLSIIYVALGRAGFRNTEEIWGLSYVQWMGLWGCIVLVFLMACLQLWYVLLDRKRDWPMMAINIVSSVCIVWWIIAPQTAFYDLQSLPRLLFIFYMPGYLYGIGLMWRGLRKMEEGTDRMRLRILFYAFLIPIIFIFINMVLVSLNLSNAEDSQTINIFTGILRSVLLVGAIQVYGLFRMDLTHASEDIFDNMDDPVFLLSKQDQIIRVNLSGQQCFGIEEKPLDPASGTKLSVYQLLAEYDENRERFDIELTTSAGPKEYQCSKTVVVRQGTSVGSVLLLRDVTKEKELARMKTEFTSTVSHELRTPLTSVLGFAKIIQKRFNEVILASFQPTEKKEVRAVKQITKNLDIIVSESKRLTKLINDVLDISKMEAGRIEWRFSRCNPRNIIDQAVQATNGLFGTKPVKLVQNVPDSLPEIVADSDRIVQVVINLISNAVKFTDEGTVTIQTHMSNGKLEIQVQDTGMGIGEADQKLVFEKYRQAGDVLTDKPQGTGLGLPISKQIVEQHGGRIWLHSAVGEGSTFAFTVPLADQLEMTEQLIDFPELLSQLACLKPTVSDRHQKILVIDDEKSIRQVLRQSLEEAGHKVFEAGDGVAGLEAVKEHRPDLVILDVMMPRKNGFDVAATLKNDSEFLNIPIIMLTVVEDAQRIYGLGVERYITKPFEPSHIVDEVRKLLQQRGVPMTMLLLGKIEGEEERLRACLTENGHRLFISSNLDALPEMVTEHSPSLLIISGSEYQDQGMQKAIRQTIGTTSIMIRTVKQG